MILSHADLADSADLFCTLHYKNLSNLLNLREKNNHKFFVLLKDCKNKIREFVAKKN
jgi:hypothetical protein